MIPLKKISIALLICIVCVTIARPVRNQKRRNTSNTQKKIVSSPSPAQIIPPVVLKKNPLYWDWKQVNVQNVYFPPHFLWGVATSAHQVEGNCTNNDWAIWEKNHCTTLTGSACDHWNRYKDDIKLIKENHFNAYRLSVEWSKIEPKPGQFDEKTLKHYEDVCKELVKNNITPMVVLHHYTLPCWFSNVGGFENINNIPLFVRYSKKVFERLKPYVPLWMVINSPTSYVARAYHKKMAPPAKENMQLMQETLKNMLEAHVQVYRALKAMPGGKEAKIGYSHNVYHIEPNNLWDKAGAAHAYKLFDSNIYTFFKTGQFNAHVPFKVSLKHSNAQAKGALDFVGLSYYSHGLMNNFSVGLYPGDIKTQTEVYSIYPEGMYRAVMQITTEFAKPLNIPIYIAENGVATNNEKDRALFYERNLYALSYAISQGCPVKGYFAWSLIDNYEWGSYGMNYGLYSVDFNTQERGKKPREGFKPLLTSVQKFTS